MIPQDSFIIVAKVEPGRLDALRCQLNKMTFEGHTGIADPANPLVPFGDYETIHFARFVVLADNTLNDRAAYRLPLCDEPTYLCFMADCDGRADELLARMARKSDGLREIFRHCVGFDGAADMLGWLSARRVKPMASLCQLGRAQCRPDVGRGAAAQPAARRPTWNPGE
jgi:hypothetical protein